LDGIALWLAYAGSVSFLKKTIIFILAGFIGLASSSNGGLLVLAFEVFMITIMKLYALFKNNKIRPNNIAIFFLVLVVLFSIAQIPSVSNFIETGLIDKIALRLAVYSIDSNITGGRLNDLQIAFKYITPLLLLNGLGKEGFTTENGHLYWIRMYGLVSYPFFMYIVFGKFKRTKIKRYIWIIPFFFAFTFNIAIGEFKWFAIMLLLVAASRYNSYPISEKRKKHRRRIYFQFSRYPIKRL
jgi:hypothetical protein